MSTTDVARGMAFARRAVIAAVALAAFSGLAPVAGHAQAKPPAADLDELIRRLEASGAFDAAIDRGIQRHIQRQIEARQRQEEEQQRRAIERSGQSRPVEGARDRIFGNGQAEVSVIVYTDYECPYCKRFAGVPEEVIAKFGGKANFVLRHYPLEFHGENARLAAYYAECVGRQAGSNGFFRFSNEWFRLTVSNGKGPAGGLPQIQAMAREAGATDAASLKNCVGDPAVAKLVQDDMADGIRGGINSTPGIIVRNNRNGRALRVVGAVPAKDLEQAVAKVLEN